MWRRAGLRLQLLLALAGVILVAYVPLFFAIAQVTRATALADREDGARALGRAIAAHVADVQSLDPSAVDRTIGAHLGERGARAITVFGAHGGVIGPWRRAAERARRALRRRHDANAGDQR